MIYNRNPRDIWQQQSIRADTVPSEQPSPPTPPLDPECPAIIVFRITSNGRVLPVNNAKVTVTRDTGVGPNFFKIVYSNSSGKTPPMCVDAPPIIYSQTPTGTIPYYTYSAIIEADGYNTVAIGDIRTFRGISTTQPIILFPKH